MLDEMIRREQMVHMAAIGVVARLKPRIPKGWRLNLTKTQRCLLPKLLIEMFADNCLDKPDTKEVKQFEIQPLHNGSISVVFAMGRKGDEGTYASVFCRYRWHLFIGPRGAISAYKGRRLIRGRKALITCRES